jgi:membrane protein implicated in regulation of membrane protease activity
VRSQRPSARGTVGHAYSALNLRLALAVFGLASSAVLAYLTARAGLTALAIFLVVLAVVAVVDLVVIQRRRRARRREEPGARHSLFE